jgi:hypothetical protein
MIAECVCFEQGFLFVSILIATSCDLKDGGKNDDSTQQALIVVQQNPTNVAPR